MNSITAPLHAAIACAVLATISACTTAPARGPTPVLPALPAGVMVHRCAPATNDNVCVVEVQVFAIKDSPQYACKVAVQYEALLPEPSVASIRWDAKAAEAGDTAVYRFYDDGIFIKTSLGNVYGGMARGGEEARVASYGVALLSRGPLPSDSPLRVSLYGLKLYRLNQDGTQSPCMVLDPIIVNQD